MTKQVREERRKVAEARNLAYSKLSLQEKLARQTPNGKVAKKLLKAIDVVVVKVLKVEPKLKEASTMTEPDVAHETSHRKSKK